MQHSTNLGPVRGTALYVSALIGPGILTLPAAAAGEAGPASLWILGLLLLFSAPIAFTFAALHERTQLPGGVPAYVAAAFGATAGRIAASWFHLGVPVGVPALGLIAGDYVQEATGSGNSTRLVVAAGVTALALMANLRRSPGLGPLPLALTVATAALILIFAILAVPHGNLRHFQGAEASPEDLARAALVLTWVLTGWEASASFSGLIGRTRTLRIVTVATLVIVAVLYALVAIPEIAVLGPHAGFSAAPVAAVLQEAAGTTAAAGAAVLALCVALGNAVSYVGSIAEVGLASAVAQQPRGRAGALLGQSLIMLGALICVAWLPIGADDLVAICAASQIPVYVLGLAAALKLLPALRYQWFFALVGLAAVTVLLPTAGAALVIPAAISLFVVLRLRRARRSVNAEGGNAGSPGEQHESGSGQLTDS